MTQHDSQSKELKSKLNKKLNEEPDYYYNEEGLMVFTASFHLKRGYCCKSGCKNCPYGFNNPK